MKCFNDAELYVSEFVGSLESKLTEVEICGITSGSVDIPSWSYIYTFSAVDDLRSKIAEMRSYRDTMFIENTHSWKLTHTQTKRMLDQLLSEGLFAYDAVQNSQEQEGKTYRPLKALQDYLDWLEEKVKEEQIEKNGNIPFLFAAGCNYVV